MNITMASRWPSLAIGLVVCLAITSVCCENDGKQKKGSTVATSTSVGNVEVTPQPSTARASTTQSTSTESSATQTPSISTSTIASALAQSTNSEIVPDMCPCVPMDYCPTFYQMSAEVFLLFSLQSSCSSNFSDVLIRFAGCQIPRKYTEVS